MITIEQFNELPKKAIFASGFSMDGRDPMRWMAYKWATGNWSLFYDIVENGSRWDDNDTSDEWQEWIDMQDRKLLYFGNQMRIIPRAQRIVGCDDEVIKLYRA